MGGGGGGLGTAPPKFFQHTDGLGSPIGVTDLSGVLQGRRIVYEPYGDQAMSNEGDGPAYTGHVSDAMTTLTYMQARYYDPVASRFLSVDPVAASAESVNRYWYANNNPYKYVDPDGRWIHIAAGGAVGAIAGAGSYAYSATKAGTFTWGGLAASTGTGAVVGAMTAAVPTAAAGLGLIGSANIAVSVSSAGAIGAAGNVANQAMTSDAPISWTDAGIAGVANAAGFGVGQGAAGFARSQATTTILPALDGLPTPSISGRMFWVGQQEAVTNTSELGAQAIQDTIGVAVSEGINGMKPDKK